MEIKEYWWEAKLREMVRSYFEDDYRSLDEIVLLVVKIIETEKGGTPQDTIE